MSDILKITKLNKTFESQTSFVAVNDISFSLKEGEILGLLGSNGAGKTTTLQMLLGILTPTSGRIEYFGKELDKYRSKILEKVAFASAYVALASNLSVLQNLTIVGLLYGIKGKELKRRIDKYLDYFGIAGKKNALVSNLSAGQSTRLMLTKAFMIEPKVLLLDEPTASLDPEIAEEVLELILNTRKKSGLSILFTSHNMGEVSQICDRILFMQQGQIIADDTPDKLARSIKELGLELIIVDGMKRALAIAETMHLTTKVENRKLTISLPSETTIATYLQKIASKEVIYSNIQILKPTLQDYFLAMVKKQK